MSSLVHLKKLQFQYTNVFLKFAPESIKIFKMYMEVAFVLRVSESLKMRFRAQPLYPLLRFWE